MDAISELNKRKVRMFVEGVWNEGRLELIDDLVAADYVGHIACVERGVFGPRGVRRLVSTRRRAHRGLHVQIDDQIAEEDRVVTRWHATITAPAARPGSAAPGRMRCYAGISIIRLLAGKLVDSHTEYTNVAPGEVARMRRGRDPVTLPAVDADRPADPRSRPPTP